jgi:LPXTG-motif cell wall-anchored protein
VASVVLIVIGVLCLVLAPITVWGRNLVLDTDRYVETLKPVASNPGVQDAVISVVDNQVTTNLDVKAYVAEVLPPRAAQALAGPLQNAVNGLVNTVATKFVRSDAFETLWIDINRLAHQQIDYLLIGKAPTSAAVHVSSEGKIELDLSAVVAKVKEQLVAAGLAIAAKVPVVGATIELGRLQGIHNVRKAVRALDTIANWLPWIGIVLAAGGIAAARRRRRALTRAALGLGAGMIVLGIGLLIGRHIYLDQVPTDKLPRGTAQFLFDTIVRFLRLGLRLVLLLALLVAVGAWVSGPSRAAVVTRHTISSVPRKFGRKIETGVVGPFVARNATAFRGGAIAVGCIVFLLIDNPSLATIITLAVLVVAVLLVIELLRASALRGRPT